MKSVHYSVAAFIITSLSIKNFVLSINFITLDRSDAQSVEMIMTWFAALCDSVCTGCSGTMEVLELKEGKQTRQRFFHRHRLDEGNNPLWSVNLCVQWF